MGDTQHLSQETILGAWRTSFLNNRCVAFKEGEFLKKSVTRWNRVRRLAISSRYDMKTVKTALVSRVVNPTVNGFDSYFTVLIMKAIIQRLFGHESGKLATFFRMSFKVAVCYTITRLVWDGFQYMVPERYGNYMRFVRHYFTAV